MNRGFMLSIIVCVLAALGQSNTASAQTFTTLHVFGFGSPGDDDGATPFGGLVLGLDGNLYGTTYKGASQYGFDSFYKLNADGSTTILHRFLTAFSGVPNEGFGPEGGLSLGPGGNFYGTTYVGGAGGIGTIYSITPDGTATVLHSFGDGSVVNDGANPESKPILGSDGNFYGTTYGGGSSNNGGTIYQMTPSGTVTILHMYDDGSVANDGSAPSAALVEGADHAFYGVTPAGGSAGQGVLFRVTASGSYAILHSFGDGTVQNDGSADRSALTLASDGSFYGTTSAGGSAGQGTIFHMTTEGVVTILHSFGDGTVVDDGHSPTSTLVLGSDGNFYGSCSYSSYMEGNGRGTIFRMTPSGTVTVLTSLDDFSSPLSIYGYSPPIDNGEFPGDLVFGTDGNLYGTTSAGGFLNGGTLFEVALTHTFSSGVCMISVPTDYSDDSLDIVLGYSSPKLAVWQPAENMYTVSPIPPADALRIGQAYWVRFPGAETMSFLGTVPLRDASPRVSLSSGWNMIGCPRADPMPMSSLVVQDSGGNYHSFSDAVSSGIVQDPLYTFQPGDTAYEVVAAASSSLQPYYGYWVYTPNACTLIYPPIVNPAPSITSVSPSSAAFDAAGFNMTINGSGFTIVSTVSFGSDTGLQTTYVSPTVLTVKVPAGAFEVSGDFFVSVSNPPPGGGTSQPVTFTVESGPPPVPINLQFMQGTWNLSRSINLSPPDQIVVSDYNVTENYDGEHQDDIIVDWADDWSSIHIGELLGPSTVDLLGLWDLSAPDGNHLIFAGGGGYLWNGEYTRQ